MSKLNTPAPARFFAARCLALLALPLALAACDNENANEAAQSGNWHISRVTATERRTANIPSVITVTDAGDFAFEDHSLSFNRVVLYLDKAIPSRGLTGLYDSRAATIAPRRYDLFWEADPGPAHRLGLRLDADHLTKFTYDERGANHETFFYLELDNQGNIGYREDWTLDRAH